MFSFIAFIIRVYDVINISDGVKDMTHEAKAKAMTRKAKAKAMNHKAKAMKHKAKAKAMNHKAKAKDLTLRRHLYCNVNTNKQQAYN